MKAPCYVLLILCICGSKLLPAQVIDSSSMLSSDKREYFIRKASELRQEDKYLAAASQLDSILNVNPKDAGVLLFKGDLMLQAKHFSEAVSLYRLLLPLNFEPTITKINLSYALFMNHQPGNALGYARKAWQENSTNTSAIVNYFNAMLWNSKTKDAERFLQQQDSLLYPGQRLVLKARLFTTKGDYNKGLMYYDSLVKSYPDKYYIQEFAEVLLGKKEVAKSAVTMQHSKNLFSVNEYQLYRQKLKLSMQQQIGIESVVFKDVAKNSRFENSIWWQQAENRRFRLKLALGRASFSSAQAEKTTAHFFHTRLEERFSLAWKGETDLYVQSINSASANNFTAVTGQQTFKYQPTDRQMVGVVFNTELLNFTASLLGSNIRNNSIGYITHLMFDGKTGFFSQGSAGFLTDKNKRYQFFGSVYRLLRTEPTLKAGVNFSALHFSDSTIKFYFSPNRYLNTELFADYTTPLPLSSKFYAQVQAAAGVQQIEKSNWEPALRLQTELGFRHNHFETSVKYQTSNVASSIGTGYKFNWLTLRVIYKWGKKV